MFIYCLEMKKGDAGDTGCAIFFYSCASFLVLYIFLLIFVHFDIFWTFFVVISCANFLE